MSLDSALLTTGPDSEPPLGTGPAQACFEALTELTRQAGTLLLADALGTRRFEDAGSMRRGCLEQLARTSDVLQRLAPRQVLVRHHHEHMVAAARCLALTLERCDGLFRRTGPASDPLPPLKAALSHLRGASRLVPGFDLVDISQGCCAEHGAALAAPASP